MSTSVVRDRRASRSRARLAALLAAAAVAVGTAGALTPTASAALGGVGPTDPDTKFPTSYTDQNGMALAQCLDGLPRCLTGRAQLTAPAGELFYFDATATVGDFTVDNALEGAYFAAGVGQEQTFMRTQVAAPKAKLPKNTGYKVTDPYGAQVCTTDKNGVIKANGCRTETAPVPGNFTNALSGRIGPFLTWDTFGAATGAPPAGYIGDGITPHRVTGSPTGFNRIRVEGPGVNTTGVDACPTVDGAVSDCIETDLFAVMGKLQAGAGAAIAPAGPVDFGASPVGTPVTKRLTYSNTGTTPATVSGVALSGANAADFATSDTCTAAPVAAGGSCTIDVTYTPQAGVTSSATLTVTDDVSATPRTIALSGSAQSTDTVAPTVAGKTPATGATAVTPASPGVGVTFSEPVQGVSTSSFTLTSPSGAVVPATVTQGAGNTWTLTPSAALATDTRYTATVTGGPTGVRDLAGNALTDTTWSFLTGPAPTVTARTPAPGATGVATNAPLAVTFSEAVVGVDNTTFTLTDNASGIVLPGTVTKGGGGAAGTTWNLKANQNLAARSTYTVAVTGGIKDAAGNPAVAASWTFTTK